MKKSPISKTTSLPIPGAQWTKGLSIQEFELPNGEHGKWEYLEFGEDPNVLILGLTLEKDVILTNVYRFPARSFCYELPGGTVESGELNMDAIRREFLEETGYETDNLEILCRGFLWNGKSNGRFEIWLGKNCKKIAEISLDPVEQVAQLTVEVMSIAEIKRRIGSGDISFDPPISHGIIALEARNIILLKA